MNIEKIEKNGTICAVVRSDEVVVTDPQSALDLLMTAKYDVGTKNIVIDKRLIKEDFFANCNNKLSIQLVRSLLFEEDPAQLRREP